MERRFSIVITRMGARNRLPQLPWLEDRYGIDEGDWIVLAHESWLALADGETAITADLERKLLTTFSVHQPDVIVVVGYSAGKDHSALAEQTRRIMRRVGACLLPTEVLGFVVDANGDPQAVGVEMPVDAGRFAQDQSGQHGGLGLALVRRPIELHEGTVAAESAGTGMGATFTILLPALNTAPASA